MKLWQPTAAAIWQGRDHSAEARQIAHWWQ